MKRNLWRRMYQNPAHNARESWWASCSILLHNFRLMSHSTHGFSATRVKTKRQERTLFRANRFPDSGAHPHPWSRGSRQVQAVLLVKARKASALERLERTVHIPLHLYLVRTYLTSK